MPTIEAAPYTARRCDECDTWIYCADGPFAEGDPTKTLADAVHYEAVHGVEPGPVVSFPFMSWNDETVTAERVPAEQIDAVLGGSK